MYILKIWKSNPHPGFFLEGIIINRIPNWHYLCIYNIISWGALFCLGALDNRFIAYIVQLALM